MATTGQTLYQLGFQVSPIILMQGIANAIPGKLLPIIAITESANFVNGLVAGNIEVSLDDFFAQYVPSSGGTLLNNQIATYPFANQTVAANSIIAQPLIIGMTMICPVRKRAGYLFKLAILSALQKTLSLHNSLGGTYAVLTPAYIYVNCLMQSMTDVSSAETRQRQWQWQMQFIQPLLTQAQATQAQSNLANQITSGNRIVGTPSWSSLNNVLSTSIYGNNNQSLLGMLKSLIPGT